MLRGYRRHVLAAFGWLILAASPPREAGANKEAQTERDIANSLDRIATTLQNGAESEVPNQPCEKGGEQSHSDLCAQWKAAEAARDGANAAWLFGVLGCLIGAATLVAAIKAAQYAKKAADHTEANAQEARRAADVAEKIGEAQTRAYVSVVDASVKFGPEDRIHVTFTLKNFGASPALGCMLGIRCAFITNQEILAAEPDHGPKFVGPDRDWGRDIAAGAAVPITSIARINAAPVQNLSEIWWLEVSLLFMFRDVFDRVIEERQNWTALPLEPDGDLKMFRVALSRLEMEEQRLGQDPR